MSRLTTGTAATKVAIAIMSTRVAASHGDAGMTALIVVFALYSKVVSSLNVHVMGKITLVVLKPEINLDTLISSAATLCNA